MWNMEEKKIQGFEQAVRVLPLRLRQEAMALPADQRARVEELSPEGRAALLPLGEVLGRYEADGQRAALKRAEEALERERERAEKERDRMGRVYQTLSLAGGAFLVILLL